MAAVFAAAAPAAAAAGSCTRRVTLDPRVPAWSAVNGFRLGAREASDEQVGAYLSAVARASRRVTVGVAGASTEGRPLRYAVVADPAAFGGARRAAVLRDLRALRSGNASTARAATLARRDPAIVWIAGSVHGNEPSGADADMALLRELAARRDCAAQARLRRLVVVILPVQNPDGRAAGTRESAAGFDLNRDWFADTQPETTARLTLLRALPPVAVDDQHEQDGRTAFAPPYGPPFDSELPRGALRAVDATFAPAVRAAFRRRGWPIASGAPYDLLYPGYGDAATSLLVGAAGMTIEVGAAASYARRVEQHLAAAEAVVRAAARDKDALLREWAASAREARAQGARGELQRSGRRAYGYALADRPDARALVTRLMGQGVAVERLRTPLRIARLDPFGAAGSVPATLPAGTYLVPLAQAAKHWIEAVLDDDARASSPSAYDVNAWGEPLLMGLNGGALRTPLPRGAALERLGRPPAPAIGTSSGDGTLLRGDDARSLGHAFDMLQRGGTLSRVPGSGEIVAGPGAAPAGALPLRPVKVAVLGGPGPATSVDWCRWVLRMRFGLPVDVLGGAQLAAEQLAAGGYTTLVVPDGDDAAAGLSDAALARVQAFVRAGGRYIGWRSRGIAVAGAAGVTAARADAPAALHAPGAAVEVRLDPSSPLAWGMAGRVYALDEEDPVLRAGDGVVGRYPAAGELWHSGFLAGAAALGSTPAVVDTAFGAGDVVLFSFDPAFRGYADGTERLLANALLAPRAT